MPETLVFYAFSALAIGASTLVIGQRNPMYSVVLLIAAFGALSGLYVLLDAPFVAIAQIIIYAGAITLDLAFNPLVWIFMGLANALRRLAELDGD